MQELVAHTKAWDSFISSKAKQKSLKANFELLSQSVRALARPRKAWHELYPTNTSGRKLRLCCKRSPPRTRTLAKQFFRWQQRWRTWETKPNRSANLREPASSRKENSLCSELRGIGIGAFRSEARESFRMLRWRSIAPLKTIRFSATRTMT